MPFSFYENPEVAQSSIHSVEAFDADVNVLVCIDHDVELQDMLPLFPNGSLNARKEKGCKFFVNDLPFDGKLGMPPLATGFNRRGRHMTDKELEDCEQE